MSECDDSMSEGNLRENRSMVNDDLEAKIGNYVIIRYEGDLFPGVITSIKENEVCVSAMEKCGAYWKWPDRKDELFYEISEIVQQKINKPEKISSRREIFRIPEMDINF